MSKTTLLDLVKTPKSELQKMKVGVLVRSTLPELLTTHLLSEHEVMQLQKLDYSKQVFDMNYPILKKVNPNLSLKPIGQKMTIPAIMRLLYFTKMNFI